MNVCKLCGEPMPEGEEMFFYHGYSGPCPKPPLPQPKLEYMAEYLHRQDGDEFWLDIRINRQPYVSLGPFGSAEQRRVVQDDLLQMVRALGGKDLPTLPQ